MLELGKERCLTCNGRGKSIGIGYVFKKCTVCSGAGQVRKSGLDKNLMKGKILSLRPKYEAPILPVDLTPLEALENEASVGETEEKQITGPKITKKAKKVTNWANIK